MLLPKETYEKFGYYPADLAKASHKRILYKCDYCYSINESSNGKYNERKNKTKDSCKTCKTKKSHETINKDPKKKLAIIEKRKDSNILKYGNTCPANNIGIQQKIQENNLIKYGHKHSIASTGIQEKIKKSIHEKYGVTNVFQLKEIREKSTQTMIEKYGKPHSIKFGNKEKEILNEINQKFGVTFAPDHSLISPKHLDGYDSTHKIAIEFCGLYWHNEDSPEPRNKYYHANKYNMCLKLGVRLFTIWEDEWKHHKTAVLNLISSSLQKNTKIHGRLCKVSEISSDVAIPFYTEHHIQGAVRNSILNMGIFIDDELLGVMTFSKHHRLNNNNHIVLSRMAFKNGITINGGPGKLLKYSIEKLKSSGYHKIISWSDNRYSQGNVYHKLGFTLEKELSPDYCYVNTNKPIERISKQKCKKINLVCKENQTELNRATELGLSRLWDCGKKRWVLDIT